VLLVGAEQLDLVDDGGEDGLRRKSGASLERGDEAVFAELFLGLVEGFGDAVGVEGEEVARGELALDGRGMPVLEEAEDGCGGVEALDLAAAAEEDGTEVAAVGVAESAGGVVVVGEEDGGVGAVGGVLEEETVDGLEEELRLVAGEGVLAAEVGLEIGHQEGGGDALASDVTDDETEALVTEGEEVVVVAADVAGLDADAGVVEGVEWGKGLGEEAGLDLLGDLELLGGAALRLEAFGGVAALALDLASDLAGAEEFEGVAIDVVEAGDGGSEEGLLGRVMEPHTAVVPELIGGVDVFGEKADLGVASDELVVLCARLGSDEGEDGGAVGRGDGDPAAIEVEARIGDDAEAELVDVKLQALVVVADVDGGFEDAEVWALGAVAVSVFNDSRAGGQFEGSGVGCQTDLPWGSWRRRVTSHAGNGLILQKMRRG
jgi:hypothetical protein